MATIKEIAELSGISRVTVSAVLKGKPGVTEKTRQKVLTTIREHDLQHRLIARSLMGHFSQMFAVVVPDISNPFYTEVIAGFLSVMKVHGNHMISHPTDGSHEDEVRTLETLMGYDLGGYVLVAAQKDQSRDHIQKVMDTGKPLVIIGAFPGLVTHIVDIADRGGSKTATDYLLAKGHRRMVCLAGLTTSVSSKERVLGFVESLLDHDMPFDDSMVVWTEANFESGYTQALEVLRSPEDRPTALVCFNDTVAIGAYRAAHELGLRIPDDISIVGFDDIEIGKVLGPPLTTISAFPREIGRNAAQILVSATKGETKGQFLHKTIQTALVERGSVRTVGPALAGRESTFGGQKATVTK
ncbi:MAG: LacI family transcriptional regulator [bacterium]|nr:LacI family transcriptional regulator [bacterium]